MKENVNTRPVDPEWRENQPCSLSKHGGVLAGWLLFLLIGGALTAAAQEKVTYEDQVTPIFRNHCFNCHNADKSKGDLDLSTYSALLKGGGSGKAVLPGDAENSKLFKSIAQTEEPFMPNSSPRIPDAEIEVVRKWIAGGLLEKSSSQALASAKPKMDLAPKAGSAKKPDGPAILPVDWLLAPVQHTERATAVTGLAAAPWSPLVAVGGQHQLLLYQSETLELAGVLPLREGNAECVRFSRDGRLLVIGGGHAAKLGFVDLYDVVTGKRVVRVGNEYDSVLAADLNSDQTEVALGGPAKHVKVFSTRTGELLHDYKKHTDWITAVEYSPDSVLLASGDRNGGLVVWEADTGQELYTLTGHQAAITSLSWRDDSQVLLSASEDGTIHLWDMREGQEVAKWTAHRDGVLEARFGHDSRIVSCGRDRLVAVWDAGGKKQRSWEAGGDLPVRAAFSQDGARVFAASWSGKVGVWLATDGKAVGEVAVNPPTLAERLEAATREIEPREAAAKKANDAAVAAQAEVAKAEAAFKAQDKSSPTFAFVESARQAHEAQTRAIEQARQALDRLKSAAAKSATDLAAAEAEAAKLQAALDKGEKLSEPYKLLTQQLETAGKTLAAANGRAAETAKALAERRVAVKTADAELGARIAVATQAQDHATAAVVEAAKRSEAASQALVQARILADQDKARVTQQQAALAKAITTLAAAEAECEAAKLARTLNQTNQTVETNRELTQRLEAAANQATDARVAREKAQQALGDARVVADKSAAVVSVAEAEAAKFGASLAAARKSQEAGKEALAQLEASRASAVEAAKKETTALEAIAVQASAALDAAKADQAAVQARLEKTEKFSEAFKEATRQWEAARTRVATVRGAADHDRNEVADLDGAVQKTVASVVAADAEVARMKETLIRNDLAYQRFQELEKQLAVASGKAAETKVAADKARTELASAQAAVARIKTAQVQAALYYARAALAAQQQQQEKNLAALADAEAAKAKVATDLSEAQQTLAAQTDKLKQLTEKASAAAAAWEAAEAAAARSTADLAARKDQAAALAAEHERLKNGVK